jgi:putative holliday junction resolvase
MGRWVAIDYGARRVGLAVADYGGRIASPAGTLEGSGNGPEDAAHIRQWALENEASGVVIGLPLNMDGTDSQQTRIARKLAAELVRLNTALPATSAPAALVIELWDERLTTFEAEDRLRAANVPAARRKQHRDTLAAQVILQSFLDARRGPDRPLGSAEDTGPG